MKKTQYQNSGRRHRDMGGGGFGRFLKTFCYRRTRRWDASILYCVCRGSDLGIADRTDGIRRGASRVEI